MIYERPVVQAWGTTHWFRDLLSRRSVDVPTSHDWRVQKLKSFIDSDNTRVRWNLDQVSKELELGMSGR